MSNINNKLDYLDETKQLIKQAIIDKGQEVSDEDTFRSYVDKISDIETGNDTKDATASSNDILYPETAYISNGKVTGNIMPTYSSNTTLSQTNTIIRSLSYSLLDINYDAKIAIISDEDYKFNFCNIVNNEIDYENSAYITLNDFEEGMDGTYTFSKCCTNFDKNTNDLYLYLLFTFQNTFKVFCYTYNIKTKSSKYIDTYELTIDDANNSLVLNMMIRPNYPNQVIVFCGYTSTTVLGSYLTTVFLQFNTVVLELQKIEDTISTSANQYAALVESCYFTSNGEYLCINVRTGTLVGTTQNGIIYHCVNNFLEQIVDSVQYVTLFENGNYIAYNQSTRNHCLFNIDGDVLYNYSNDIRDIAVALSVYTNKCILGNYLFGFAYPEDFINPTEPLILYCCKLNEDYTIIKEYEINVGSRTLFNCYNAILYDNKTTRNFDGYLGDIEKEIISLERNNINYYSTKDSDTTINDVVQGKIFYNSKGKQIGIGEFGNFVDIDLSYINASITITGDIKNLIGNTTGFMMKNVDVDKCKIYDIIIVPINMFETGSNIPNLKCNCVCKIESITADLSSSYSYIDGLILAADINTEDGTATSEDIVEGKIAYVNNERVHGIAKLGIDTSDATATVNDILSPKTAYVNGEKITGSMKCSYVSLGDANAVNITGDVSFWVVDLERQLAINGSERLIHIRRIESNVIGDTDALTIDLSIYSVPEQFNIYSAKFGIDADTNSVGVWASLTNTNINSAFIFLELDVKTLEVLNTPIYKEFNLDLYNSTNSNYVSALNIFPRPTYRNQIGFLRKTTDTKYGIVLIEASSTDMSIIDSTSQGYWIFGGETYGGTEFTCTWSSDGRYIWGRSRAAGTFRWKGNFRILYDCTQKKTLSSDYDIILFNDKYALSRSTLYRLPDMSVVRSGLSFSFLSGNNTDIEPSNIWCGFCGKYTVFCENNNLHRMIFDETNLTISTDSNITISGTPLCNAVPNKYLTWVKDNKISGYQYLDDSLLVSIERDGIIYYNTYDANPNASNVLINTVVYGDVGKIVGTMPNNGELNYEVSTIEQPIPSGYTSGGIIAASPILQEDYDNCLNIANQILGNTAKIGYIYTEDVITFNYIPNNKSRVEICAAIDGNNWNNYFGMNSTQFLLQRWGDRNEWRLFIADIQQGGDLSGIAQYEQQIVEISREGLFINKELIQSISSTDYSNISTNKQLHLNGNYPTKFKFWYMKIWEDDILVRNYQVIHLFNNQVIYDNITNTFIDYIKAEEV